MCPAAHTYHVGQSIVGTAEGFFMMRVKSGSMVLLIIGLLWLMGIIGTILYSIGSQVYAIALVREVQMRSWVALESGLAVALAHIQTDPNFYRHERINVSHVLYSGDWPIDPRHPQWQIGLEVQRGQKDDQIDIKGTLVYEKNRKLVVVWHLEYKDDQWIFIAGERMFLD